MTSFIGSAVLRGQPCQVQHWQTKLKQNAQTTTPPPVQARTNVTTSAAQLVIITTRQDFLAGGGKVERMLKLSNI